MTVDDFKTSLVGRTARESVPHIIDHLRDHPADRNVVEPMLQRAVAACLDGHGDVKWEART